MIDKTPLSVKTIGELYGLDGAKLQRQYKQKISTFKAWKESSNIKSGLVYPGNIGKHLSIDETALSNGELYTVVTSKKAKGKKGCLVALLEGTKSEEIIPQLLRINKAKRFKVEEITLDMAGSMNNIAKTVFPKAKRVIDRFHVQKLANDAVQELRIKYRWEAIEQENKAISLAKAQNKNHKSTVLDNGDTPKQLLARSRYLLFKHHSKWTVSQKERSEILFERFPNIEKAYCLSNQLFSIYQFTENKGIAFTKLAQWYNEIEQSGFKSFGTVMRTVQLHYEGILNYFDNRSTNASAESFNSKIKAFRTQFRGVKDINFFLFRAQVQKLWVLE